MFLGRITSTKQEAITKQQLKAKNWPFKKDF